jgi:hypothetical protein
MAWADVASKIKFYGPDADDLGHATGLDGMPPTVNGIAPYGVAFSTSPNAAGVPREKADILDALKFLYDNSPRAQQILDTGAGDIWLMKAVGGSGSFSGTRTAVINMSDAVSFSWMGSDGRFKTDTLGGHVIHELMQ